MSSNNLFAKVHDRVAEVKRVLASKGYPNITINSSVGSLNRGVAGIAKLYDREVVISREYLEAFPKQVLAETVAHEVCHHYVWHYFPNAKQHHGPEFRRLMRMLGFSGDTKHTMRMPTDSGVSIKSRKVTRYVYVVAGNSVNLTSQQHKKLTAGTRKFTYKGVEMTVSNFSGKIIKV